MQQTEQDTPKFQLVLPTPSLPPSLAHVTTNAIPQFLVGYRNILVA